MQKLGTEDIEMGDLSTKEFAVYDRQLRLWGFQAQKKMKESQVLIINLESVCTELARHLVLSGVNVHLVDQQKGLTIGQTTEDFLINPDDMNKVRGSVIKQKLAEMNPFSKIEFAEDYPTIESLEQLLAQNEGKYSAVVCSFQNWEDACTLNDLSRKYGLPFYALKSSGLYAFAFADIGPQLTFTHASLDPTKPEEEG